jgi:hypothetical protein
MAEPARIGWAVVGEIEFVEGERLLVGARVVFRLPCDAAVGAVETLD